MADVGQGSTIELSGGFSAPWTSIRFGDYGVETHKVTTLADTFDQFIAGRVVDGGMVEVGFNHIPGEMPEPGWTGEVVVTYPLPVGGTTPATLTFTGIVQKGSGEHTLEPDSVIVSTLRLKVTGEPVFVEAT